MKQYNVTVQGTQVSESPLSYTEAKDKATQLREIRANKGGDFCENVQNEPIQIVLHA